MLWGLPGLRVLAQARTCACMCDVCVSVYWGRSALEESGCTFTVADLVEEELEAFSRAHMYYSANTEGPAYVTRQHNCNLAHTHAREQAHPYPTPLLIPGSV